jgi:two-component system, sensor histidine kinase
VLERLLSDVLDQAKIEAGNFQLQLAPFDLRAELEAAGELMRAKADEKGVVFAIAYGAGAEGTFLGDAVRLKQIVSNLASNAIKFTAVGRVDILVAFEGSEEAGAKGQLRLSVIDTGVGFDAETGERLFNRFVQADGSISRQFGGTGLGLAICKALSELMGGTIEASSQPGKGSVFIVELPIVRTISLADHRAPAQVLETDEAAAPVAGLKVLLAEDHPTNRRVAQLILAPLGVEIVEAEDGRQALEAFARERFDLILMDMQMPVMDGLAATRAIRQLELERGLSPTPLAMLTANAMDEHRRQAALAGADHLIAKPITPDSLVAGLEATFAQAAAAAGTDRQAAAG